VVNIFMDFHRVGVTVFIATYDDGYFAEGQPRKLVLDHGRLK
jgi:ABC-type ATPase involved in cell division